MFLRLHNVENIYYRHLYKHETSVSKKFYFLLESILLKQYEKSLPKNIPVFAMSTKDAAYCSNRLRMTNVQHLPTFIPYTLNHSQVGKGNYCLYHANLSVAENEAAANWLLTNVFSKLLVPLFIAGKNPTKKLRLKIQQSKNITLLPNPSEDELQILIANAQINILPSFNNTGIKLKLINALFTGKHCIVNDATVAGTAMETACHIANNSEKMIHLINKLYTQSFTFEEVEKKKKLIELIYDNKKNVAQLIRWIW